MPREILREPRSRQKNVADSAALDEADSREKECRFVTLSGGSILSSGTVSSGAVAGGSVGAVVSGAGTVVSGLDQPTEVVVTDADVSGVRVMVRRPARR